MFINEERQHLYENLIQEILSTKQEQELIFLLHINGEIVDFYFTSVMEYKSFELETIRKEDADKLQHLALLLRRDIVELAFSKLPATLKESDTEAYLQPIKEMLIYSPGDPLFWRSWIEHGVVDAGLVQTMRQVANIIKQKSEPKSAEVYKLEDLLISMAELLEEDPFFQQVIREIEVNTPSHVDDLKELNSFIIILSEITTLTRHKNLE